MSDEEIRSTADCQRVEDEDGNKFVIIAADKNVYSSEKLKDPENDLMKTYIAVHNKKTKEVKLIQVSQSSFKHVLYDNNRSMFEQNIVDSNKLLNKEFSGKRGAAAYERKVSQIK